MSSMISTRSWALAVKMRKSLPHWLTTTTTPRTTQLRFLRRSALNARGFDGQ